MDMIVFLSLFFVLSVTYIAMGLYASRSIETNDDYFLAGRGLGLRDTTMTLIATQVGGGMLLGTAVESYATGWYGLLYSLGMTAGLLILGFGLASKFRDFNIATIPELFQTRYGSPFLRKIASLISALSLLGITAGLVVSTRGVMAGLGITYEWIAILFWLIVIIYTMFGGLKAVVVTDVLQVCIIVSVFLGLFVYSLLCDVRSGISVFSTYIDRTPFSLARINYTGLFLMPVLFATVQQDLAQRFFASRSKAIARGSAIIAAVCILLFSVVPVYFGMKAKILGLVVPAGANPLIITLQSITSDTVLAVIVCAVLAAIISTADSLLCATGSLLAQDFDISFSTPKKQMLFSQGVIVVTGLCAIYMGYYFDNILSLFAQSYELTISCLCVPVLACFVSEKSLNKYAAGGAMLGGLAGFVVFRIWPIGALREVASLALSLVSYYLVSRRS